MVRAEDRYKVGYYKGEVLIALVSVLDIIPLAVIYMVTYAYNKWLKVKYLLTGVGWAGIYRGLIVLAVFVFLGAGQCFLKTK